MLAEPDADGDASCGEGANADADAEAALSERLRAHAAASRAALDAANGSVQELSAQLEAARSELFVHKQEVLELRDAAANFERHAEALRADAEGAARATRDEATAAADAHAGEQRDAAAAEARDALAANNAEVNRADPEMACCVRISPVHQL